jgi:hypothetical protein
MRLDITPAQPTAGLLPKKLSNSRLGLCVFALIALVACEHTPSAGPRAELGARGKPEASRAAAPIASIAVPAVASALPCLTAASLDLSRLLELRPADANERAALVAARRELERLLQVPAEFYVTLQSTEDLILLELWHESSFDAEHCGKRENPGEHNRTLTYDVRKARIVASKVWP